MHLIRDILDKKVLDRKRRPMGRVDGLVIEMADAAPPRVVGLELGAITLGHRLGPRTGAWVARAVARLGGSKHRAAFRIPWSAVIDVGRDVEVSVDLTETPLRDWQNWLNRRIVRRIPGS